MASSCKCRDHLMNPKDGYPSWVKAMEVALKREARGSSKLRVYRCPTNRKRFHLTKLADPAVRRRW